jgi:hypothetical protein
MESNIVTIRIPPAQTEVDPVRVHAWLTAQGHAVTSVALRYSNGDRDLIIQTNADVAPLFANWGTVPRSEVREAIDQYRSAVLAVRASALPQVFKDYERAVTRVFRVKFGLGDDT